MVYVKCFTKSSQTQKTEHQFYRVAVGWCPKHEHQFDIYPKEKPRHSGASVLVLSSDTSQTAGALVIGVSGVLCVL